MCFGSYLYCIVGQTDGLLVQELHPSFCDCLKTLCSFCCQSSVCCAVLPTEFIRTSGFLCSWPDDTAETSKWSNSHHICFWTIT